MPRLVHSFKLPCYALLYSTLGLVILSFNAGAENDMLKDFDVNYTKSNPHVIKIKSNYPGEFESNVIEFYQDSKGTPVFYFNRTLINPRDMLKLLLVVKKFAKKKVQLIIAYDGKKDFVSKWLQFFKQILPKLGFTNYKFIAKRNLEELIKRNGKIWAAAKAGEVAFEVLEFQNSKSVLHIKIEQSSRNRGGVIYFMEGKPWKKKDILQYLKKLPPHLKNNTSIEIASPERLYPYARTLLDECLAFGFKKVIATKACKLDVNELLDQESTGGVKH